MNSKNEKSVYETEVEYKLRMLFEWMDRHGLTEDVNDWKINDLAILIGDLFKIKKEFED